MSETTFDNKCAILADFFSDYIDDPQFASVVRYNNIGLPLAFVINAGIVEPTARAEGFVNETFDYVLSAFGIESDTGFEELDEIIILNLDAQE